MPFEKEIVTVIKLIKKASKKFWNTALMEVASQPKNAFQVLISCLLSLRTRDSTTAKATKKLFLLANTPKEMIKLTTKQIEKAIYPVGFYRVKARRILDISKVLLDEYSGKVPDSLEELLLLKGVGRKTANIVIVYGFGKPGMPIDIHCHRIPNRLGWVQTKTPEQTEKVLRTLIPKRFWLDFNNTFVTFGQNVCTPVRPHCWKCPVTKYCRYYREVYRRKMNKENKQ